MLVSGLVFVEWVILFLGLPPSLDQVQGGGCGLPGGECLCRLVDGRGGSSWAMRKV